MPRGPDAMTAMNATRIERDAFGPVEIPADRYWGAQTPVSYTHLTLPTILLV